MTQEATQVETRGMTLGKKAALAVATGLLALSLGAGTAFAAGPPEGAAYGTNGNDLLRGGALDDTFVGNKGNDVLLGRGGNDSLFGGTITFREGDPNGRDVLVGGSGNDFLNGGGGRDVLKAGSGNDTIFAADGQRDVISCGSGRDSYVADPVDVVADDCEVEESGRG